MAGGTVGFDRDIFTGSPSLQHLLDTYTPVLTDEEQAFLDNEVDELCKMVDDFDVTNSKDMTAEAWDFMRDKGFFAMKIPKEWGGKGFSTHCVSSVLAKIGSHSFDVRSRLSTPSNCGGAARLTRDSPPSGRRTRRSPCQTRWGRVSCSCATAPTSSAATSCRASPTAR